MLSFRSSAPALLAIALTACSTAPTSMVEGTAQSSETVALKAAEAELPADQKAEAAEAATIRNLGAPASVDPAQVASFRAMIAKAEGLIGAKTNFKDDGELMPYLASLTHAKPAASYDRQGYLRTLGLEAPLTSGKTDDDTFAAVRALKGYTVGVNIGDHELASQALALKIALAAPRTYAAIAVVLNPMLEAYGRLRANWKKPFTPAQTAHPLGVASDQRYADAYRLASRFDPDVHSGEPGTIPQDRTGSYGTYGIARGMGFSDEVAKRIATTCNNVDEPGKTPYGKTQPLPMGALDRHFNLDRKGQDTRYVWAARHFNAAVDYAKKSAYVEAEIELGCGLHSLQDSFAHGQLTPCLHGTIGDYPDNVRYDPIAYLEARQATTAYLKQYLDQIR